MAIEENTQKYDDKTPTNLRLDTGLKDKLQTEAKKTKTNMSEIINEMLNQRYK